MTHWSELVELYEYKVSDLLAGRSLRGGMRPLAELRAALLEASLEPALHHRLAAADRQYREHLRATRPEPKPVPEHWPQPGQWQAPVTGDPALSAAWEELHLLSWHDQVRKALQAAGVRWLREPTLLTLRVLYTVLENAERAGTLGQERMQVPAAGDPLVELHDREVLGRVTQAIANLLLHPDGPLRLRKSLSDVQDTPFPRHPDEDVISARISAVERERLAPEERERLIRSLQEQYNVARDPRERPAIREAARQLAFALEPLLQGAPASTRGSVPARSVLYAATPNLALPAVDDGADQLLVFLRGGANVRWRGVEWRWRWIEPNWQLHAAAGAGEGVVALLRPDAPAAERGVDLRPGAQFRAFVSGPYLLLRAETSPEEELSRRAALGRAVALLLDPAGNFAYLRLARAAAQLLRDGRVDAGALSPRSALKYRAASADTLVGFARRGVTALSSRLSAAVPAEVTATLERAAQALGMDARRAAKLADALRQVGHEPPALPPPVEGTRATLGMDGSFVSLQVGEEPVSILVGSRAMTLRHDFKGELAAVIPGHAAVIVHDLSVLRLPELSVLVVRHGRWLAAAVHHDEYDEEQDTLPLLAQSAHAEPGASGAALLAPPGPDAPPPDAPGAGPR